MLPIQAVKRGAALIAFAIAAAPSLAAAQPGGVVIDINDPKRTKYPLAVPPAAPAKTPATTHRN